MSTDRPTSAAVTTSGARCEPLERRVLLSAAAAAAAGAGYRDLGFGDHGQAFVDVAGRSVTAAAAAAVQADGKILLAGSASDVNFRYPDFALARLNADGSPDATFGQNGTVLADASDWDTANQLALQPDGKILLAGVTWDYATTLLRYNPDGSPDPTFGDGGVVRAALTTPGLGAGRVTALALQPDGRIVLTYYAYGSGYGVARFNADGSPDASFGQGGSVRVPVATGSGPVASGLLVRPDGKLLLAGSDGVIGSSLVRLNADGSLDTTFGTGGSVNRPLAVGDGSTLLLAALPGGGFVVAGAGPYTAGVQVARFSDAGARDAAWGPASAGGVALVATDTPPVLAGLAARPDGAVLVAATSNYKSVLARLTPAGLPDPAFGDGAAGPAVNNTADVARAAAFADDGSAVFVAATGGGFWAARQFGAASPKSGPVADPGGPYVADEVSGVRLRTRRSFDPDGPLVKYEWDFGYDGTTFTTDYQSASPADDLWVPGDRDGPAFHNVALRVTDRDGNTAVAATTVTINDVPPQLSIGGGPAAAEGAPYTLTLNSYDFAPDTITSWTIDWGDGSPPQVLAGNPKSVTHVFRDGPADDVIRATATDEDGTYAATAGLLDLTFGVHNPPYSYGGSVRNLAGRATNAAAVLPDGKILAAGDWQPYVNYVAQKLRPALVRVLPDGAADTKFGDGFRAGLDPSISGTFLALATQPDGRVVAAGRAERAGGSGFDWLVARFTAAGAADPTFGTGGVVRLDFGAGANEVDDLALLPDGRVLLAGVGGGRPVVARLNPDGTPDALFGAAGRLTDTFAGSAGTARALLPLPDGRLLVGGEAGDQWALARLGPDGAPDATFGTAGVRTGDAPPRGARGLPPLTRARVKRLALDAAGRILAIVEGDRATLETDTAVLRLTGEGADDASFGTGGAVLPLPVPANDRRLAGLAVGADGTILLGGVVAGRPTLARLRPDGSPDPTFGADGLFQPTNVGHAVSAMLPLPNGNVLLAGTDGYASAIVLSRYNVLGAVHVADAPPSVSIGGLGAALPGEPYSLELHHADPGDDVPQAWTVDWGDGQVEVVAGNPPAAAHRYAAPSRYVVRATVTDEERTHDAAAPLTVGVVQPAAVGADGTLSVYGSPASGLTELTTAGGSVTVRIDGMVQTFGAAGVARIHAVLPGGGTASLGPGLGEVRVEAVGSGGDGDLLLLVGSDGDDVMSVAPDAVGGAGTTATVSGFERFEVRGGGGADAITVSTGGAATAAAGPDTTISGGDGDDTLRVATAPAGRTVSVVPGAGADTVVVAPGALGRVDVTGGDAADRVVFNGTDGYDAITVSPLGISTDGGGGGGRSATVKAPVAITIAAGGGNDRVTVGSRPSNPLRLDGGDGDDVFTFDAGSTTGVLLTPGSRIDGGAGDDAVLVDDRARPFGGGYYRLSDASIMRDESWPPTDLAAVESVEVWGGSGGDKFLVTPSAATTFTVAANGPATPPGSDPFVYDRLKLDLAGATDPRQESGAAGGAGRFTFANRRPVNYSGVEALPTEFVPPAVLAWNVEEAWNTSITFTLSEPIERLTGYAQMERGAVTLEDLATGRTMTPDFDGFNTANNRLTCLFDYFRYAPLPTGDYRVTLRASGVRDASGNPLAADFVREFHFDGAPHVSGRSLFYNNSAWDGRSAAANAADDAAVAPDKRALRPGERATPQHVTGSTRGINGIMVDLAFLPGVPTAADFEFRVGRSGDPATWPLAPAPAAVTLRSEAGVNRTGRVTITWPDGAIKNTWLRVTVKATARTGLGAPDVFYFGSLVGEAGGDDLRVTALDYATLRMNVGRSAPVNSPFDPDRDGRVTAFDLLTARANVYRNLPAFTAPPAAAATAPLSGQALAAAERGTAPLVEAVEREQEAAG